MPGRLPSDPSKPIKIDLPISHAGAFIYWIEYDGLSGRVKGREGYFNIDPILQAKERSSVVSPDGKQILPAGDGGLISETYTPLPLDGLVILTVVSKWMGPIEAWKAYFQEASSRGYNMLHFTPLQQRGDSDSPYSIADQAAYDKTLFGSEWKGSTAEGTQLISEIIQTAKDQYGLLSLTDIVLNHTANNCSWLEEHPEAGYSPHNTPHLTPALEIDNCILDFSSGMESMGLPTLLKTSHDLDQVMAAFSEKLRALNLWQYYVLNREQERDDVRAALDSHNLPQQDYPELASASDVVSIATVIRKNHLLLGVATFSKRYCVKVEATTAAAVVKAAFGSSFDSKDDLAEVWGRVVDVLNVDLYKEANEDMEIAIKNIRNRVQYTRLDENGPRLASISKQ